MELDLGKVLNKVLNDRKFLETVIESKEGRFPKDIQLAIKQKLGLVLAYYIITEDTTTDYTFNDILKKYEILSENTTESEVREIIERGYLTHSFNASAEYYVEKYGFDYIPHLNDIELARINAKRKRLDYLSQYGENFYLREARYIRHKEGLEKPSGEEFYYCTPGAMTMEYALEQSPERLYNGVLKDNKEPMIVGETKKDYLIKSLKNKLIPPKSDYPIIEEVINDYGKTDYSYIALLAYEDMKDIRTSVTIFNESKSRRLCDIIDGIKPTEIREFFPTTSYKISLEKEFIKKHGYSILGNMVTLTQYLPKAKYLIKVPDMYQIMQIYARNKGLHVGQSFDFKTGEYIRTLTLPELKILLKQLKDEADSLWVKNETLENDIRELEEMINNINLGVEDDIHK